MNMRISQEFGQYFARLPLKKSANITHGNALQVNWESVVPKDQLTYVLGNPPFVGQQLLKPEQREDMDKIFAGVNGAGVLDYVTAWYLKAAQYIQDTNIKVAFVSTNSVAQGEQVGILWNELFHKYKIKIHFAHRTFNWKNEARGNAAVHVVIIGFANFDVAEKYIYEYENIKSEPHELKVKNISPYLVEGREIVVQGRTSPICDVPKMSRGNSPYDNGHLIFTDSEVKEFLIAEPGAKKFIKELISAREFLNNQKRWCLWLHGAEPSELKTIKLLHERIKKVYDFRINSKGAETRKYASTPSLFRDKNNPDSFIVIPRVSSENRKYIPMGFFTKEYIPSDTCMILPNGKLYHFGILTSEMHMAWVKYVCGRLKSDFRYSKDIVYNNFPWPENPSEKQIKAVEAAAQKVLDARAAFPTSSLADLYDPLTMPPALVKAHQELDKAVDLCYRPQAFASEAKRMEFLFELYEKYTAGLFVTEKPKKGKKKEVM